MWGIVVGMDLWVIFEICEYGELEWLLYFKEKVFDVRVYGWGCCGVVRSYFVCWEVVFRRGFFCCVVVVCCYLRRRKVLN